MATASFSTSLERVGTDHSVTTQNQGSKPKRKGARGRFTDRELQQLEQGLRTVCAELGLPASSQQFTELATRPRAVRRACIDQRPETADLLREWGGIWKRVASFVPGRKWRQVYDTARRRYAPNNYLGDWTKEQLELLEQAVEQHGPCWSKVAEEVGRFASSCRDKWRQSFENRGRLRGRWSSDERRRLVEAVAKFGRPTATVDREISVGGGCDGMERMPNEMRSNAPVAEAELEAPQKRRRLASETHGEGFWTRVAEYVRTRSEFQCRCEWQRHLDPRRINRRGSAHHTAALNWQFLAILEKFVTPGRDRQVPRDVSEIPWGQVHPGLNAYRCYLWWRQLLQRYYPESPMLSSDVQVRRNAPLLMTIQQIRVRLLQHYPQLGSLDDQHLICDVNSSAAATDTLSDLGSPDE